MELPEHKQLAEDLRRAKARRVEAQRKMFSQPGYENYYGRRVGEVTVPSTNEYEKASERERELGGALQTLGNEAGDQLIRMLRAREQGERINEKEAARLSAIVNDINADLSAIRANPGQPVSGPARPWMKGENNDVRQ